jgi:biopolymer transport protein ExbD
MAFSVGGEGSGGLGRRRRYGGSTLSEINVVPLVDVVLVLLIIFMLTAQAMQFGLEIEVPKVRTEKASAQDYNVVNITKAAEIYFNDKPANINELADLIKSNHKAKELVVYIRADKQTPWDPIAQVVAVLTEAKIGIKVVTETDDRRGRR